MLWKSVTALIVLFWAVMTTLLVRHSYFPDVPVLKTVPVSELLSQVASRRDIVRSTLSLMRNGERRGNADLAISEWREPLAPSRSGFHFQAGGQLTTQVSGEDSNVTWRFDGDLREAGGWESMTLAVRTPSNNSSVFIGWKQGDEMPKIEVWRGQERIMDTKQALEQARQQKGSGLGMMGSMLPGFLGKQTISLQNLVSLQAESGVIPLAGKKRKGYILTLSLMGFYQAKASYTENGELTRVELPQGWQLIDPLLEGIDASFSARP